MKGKLKYLGWVTIAVLIATVTALALHSKHIVVFDSAGTVGTKERNLMLFTLLLSVVIVLPVFAMTFGIVWRYRADRSRNANRTYKPEWDNQRWIESAWWAIPCAIILVLAVITWRSSHELDPYKALNSSKKPITIQVVALQWKWLFIYPDQNVATVNFVEFPEDTPVNFEITSDAPMNSFWIPQLGGQVYAMTGMSTQLHLQADKPGDYAGSSANISGAGFAGMRFTARATTDRQFTSWLRNVKHTKHDLSLDAYNQLAMPSKNNPQAYYAPVHANLYDTIVMKYMDHHDMSVGY